MAAKAGNKNAVGNKGGRPTKYITAFAKQAYKLCLLGATDKELADFFEVDECTLNTWKKKHIEFNKSLKGGKILADANVGAKLFERATGYSHADVDIKMHDGRIIKTRLIKHYPPDTTAAIFWLKNRQPQNWRDKQLIEFGLDNFTDNQLDQIFEYLTKSAK